MKQPIAGGNFSKAFLEEVGAPPYTTKLTFVVEAGGLLNCTATYHTGEVCSEAWLTDTKTWEVQLSEDSPFRKLIQGDLS